ncbi:MAG: type II secretion system protein M [Deltaproteobacteria bacterium]|nr:type II secretion system protein M [Deltaproteobacteria bacterium]
MKLAKREKYLVALGLGFIVTLFLFTFLISPFFEKRDRLKRSLSTKEEALQEIVMLSAEYEAQSKGAEGLQETLARRERDFTLFSFLEKAAGESNVKDTIKYMKPSVAQGSGPYKESMVQMELEKITLKQLVDYLYRIESQEKAVAVRRIEIRENKREQGYLNAVIHVLTFQMT